MDVAAGGGDESRPGTTASEMAVEEQSVELMTRVMSATGRRVGRLLESRGSSRAPSALADYDASTDASADWAVAERVVSDVCAKWPLGPEWKSTVKRLAKHESQFLLEAIFSIPTRRRPVPTATASVLFSVDPGEGGFGAGRPITAEPAALDVGDAPPELAERGAEGHAEHAVAAALSAAGAVVRKVETRLAAPPVDPDSALQNADVVFSVEAQDLIHSAPAARFSEQWLHDVLAAKRLTHGLGDEILGPRPLA